MTLSEKFPDEMLPVKVIHLTQRKFTIIDPEDYSRIVSAGWWYAYYNRGKWYVKRNGGETKGSSVHLHSFITGNPMTDHANGNGLDNRRSNLRECNKSLNGANRSAQINNKSGFKGVSYCEQRGNWLATIRVNGRGKYLGRYSDEISAALIYDHAAVKHFGDFAFTNSDTDLVSHSNCESCECSCSACRKL